MSEQIFVTEQIYERLNLNFFGDYYPQVTFRNGTTIRFQDDGNLVVYDTNGQPVANSGVQSPAPLKALTLVFQEDGDLAAYNNGERYWHSSTQTIGYRLVLTQESPYIQILDSEDRVIWDIVSNPRP